MLKGTYYWAATITGKKWTATLDRKIEESDVPLLCAFVRANPRLQRIQ